VRQIDLSSFAEGPNPRPLAADDDEGEDLGGVVPGGRCSRCGKPLRGGGLKALGWPGRVCWNCFHKPGRRDGRADASRDAAAERNCGYGARR
jgi:hypothetical protein